MWHDGGGKIKPVDLVNAHRMSPTDLSCVLFPANLLVRIGNELIEHMIDPAEDTVSAGVIQVATGGEKMIIGKIAPVRVFGAIVGIGRKLDACTELFFDFLL